MPNALVLSVVSTNAVVMALLTTTFFYLWQKTEGGRSASAAWAVAYGFGALSLLARLSIDFAPIPVDALAGWLTLVFVASVWFGTRIFNAQPANAKLLSVLVFSLLAWVWVAQFLTLPTIARGMPLQGVTAVLMMLVVQSFWQRKASESYKLTRTMAALAFCRAALLFAYPFVAEDSFFRMNFSWAESTLDIAAGMLMVVIFFTDQARRKETQSDLILNRLMEDRRAYEELHKRDAIFAKIFQLVPDTLTISRVADGRFVEVNHNWEAMTGFTYEEGVGHTSHELGMLAVPEERDHLLEAIRRDGVAHDCDLTLRHKRGHLYYNKVSGSIFEADGEQYMMLAVNDVSAQREVELARKAADVALRDRDQRLATVFDLMPDAMTISRLSDGFYVEVNRSWSQMFGFAIQEAMGRSSFDLNFWVDPKERSSLIETLKRDGEVRGFEVHARCKDGTVLLVAGYCSFFESAGEKYMLSLMHDITQERQLELARLQMEATMRQREQQLSSILDAMAEGVVLRDRAGHVITSNAAAAEIYGISADAMQSISDLADTEFLREDGSRYGHDELPAVQVFNLGYTVKDTVMGVVRKAGDVRWTLVNAVPIWGEDAQNVVAVVSTLTDITKIKEIETRLRDRDAFQTRVFQLVPDTLTVSRMADGKYVDVNRNWEELTGYTPEQTIGRTSVELGIWGGSAERMRWIQAIQRDGELRDFEATLHDKHGARLDCRLSGSKFEAGGEDFLLFSIKNIMKEKAAETARLQAESLLRDSELKFSTVFQLSPVPLGLTHVDTGKFIEVNDAWLVQFGYQREEVIGRTSTELNVWVDLADREQMVDEMSRNQAVDRLAIKGHRRDGQVINCLLSGRILVFNDQRMFIFSPVDVTRQLEIEREIREINHQLEERVRMRTLKLEQANSELAATLESLSRAKNELVRSEKMAALGSLVAGVAHELNTPIGNSVTVASTLHDQTQALLQDIAQGSLKRSRLDQYLNNAATGSDLLMRSLGVARDLVSSFKQVAVDQASNKRRHFDLTRVLEDLMVTLGPMFKKTPYKLELDLAAGIEFDSYPGPFGQVVTNLLANALAHAFEGRTEGAMRISTRLMDSEHAELCFSDDGVGIPEKNLSRVFDPFFTTRLGKGGSGLGMNIVYNIVTGVLGGGIELTSQVGKGTQVTISLPLSAPENVNDHV